MFESTYSKIIFKKISQKKTAKYSIYFILALILISFLYPIFSKTGYDEINLDKVLLPPSAEHWFGTDALGRDVFTRVIYGGRVSLMVGFVSEGIAILIGVILGSLSGYFGGKIDSLIMRLTDVMLCIPTFFLIISATAYVEPSIWNIMIIIGLTGWMSIARLVRGEFLSLREREFVMYEKAIGNKNFIIMFKHILPNALNPVIVSASFGIAGAILTETALSFLGLGVQPPVPSWGNILTSGKDILEIAWWISLFPGLFILLSVLCYNLIGEGLKDALNPRQYD
ncbi:MAG: ABC transporter permease [Proteobacteria bacterium]|nr:ABC transporter permease [Pseudomonadota bacterium]